MGEKYTQDLSIPAVVHRAICSTMNMISSQQVVGATTSESSVYTVQLLQLSSPVVGAVLEQWVEFLCKRHPQDIIAGNETLPWISQ